MSKITARPKLRWLAPAAVLGMIASGAAIAQIPAEADSGLQDITAEQLLTDIANAKQDGFSGTVVSSTDLGLPQLPSGMQGSASGDAVSTVLGLLTGDQTMKVWVAGEEKARVALLENNAETDVITNKDQTWLWSFSKNTATQIAVTPDPNHPDATKSASPTPMTPDQAAKELLGKLGKDATISVSGTDKVAGRSVYDLSLTPKSSESLIGRVELAVDGTTKMPLAVQVTARNTGKIAASVSYTSIDYSVPADSNFSFTPPPGATVKKQNINMADARAKAEAEKSGTAATKPATTVVGSGWTSVLITDQPTNSAAPATSADAKQGETAQQRADAEKTAKAFLDQLPKVSGSWGSGRLLSTNLVNVIITDDGRVAAGAVSAQQVEQALAQK